MITNKPFIHLFKTRNGHYLYDANRNIILSINKDVYNFLDIEIKNWNGNISYGNLSQNETIKKMQKDNLILPSKICKIYHPATNTVDNYLNKRLCMITLQVTQKCNLRCDYCIYSGKYSNRHHSNKTMSLETAKKGIDFLLRHSLESDAVSIGFYGGEPLLEISLIKECVEYVKLNGEGRIIYFHITTNGTLINKQILEFFNENNFILLISLDGPKSIHDKSRKFAFNQCGTFDKVMENVEYISRYFPKYVDKVYFNSVIDPRNDLSCINQFFLNNDTLKKFKKRASFVDGRLIDENSKIESNIDFETEWHYELFLTYLNKMGRLNSEYISSLALGYFHKFKSIRDILENVDLQISNMHHSGPCIPGVQRLFMSTNGTLYPCERVDENSELMKIGHINEGFYVEKIKDMLNIGKITEDLCKECWAIRFCNLCAAHLDGITNFSNEKKVKNCKNVIRNTHNFLIDYCRLKELGYNFQTQTRR